MKQVACALGPGIVLVDRVPCALVRYKFAIVVASFLTTLCTSLPSRADDAALRATLQTRYAALKAAMDSRDPKAISAMLTPDFVSVDVLGKSETGAEMIADLGAVAKDPTRVSDTTLASVSSNGSVATVDQRYHMTAVKTAADGTQRNVELATRATDTWFNANGTWLLQKTATMQLDYYVNGKLVAHRIALENQPNVEATR